MPSRVQLTVLKSPYLTKQYEEANMRTQGSYEYREDAMDIINRQVTDIPQTTLGINNKAKNLMAKICHKTTKRLLEELYKQGKIKRFISGKTILWQR